MRKKVVVPIIIAIVVVVLIVIGIVGSTGKKSDDTSKTNNDNTSQQQSAQPGEKSSNPISVGTEALSMTGQQFADKYAGKFVAFDGLIQGTATIRGASGPHTQLVIGDDIEKGMFADASAFWIASSSMTFSDDLHDYTTDNSTPYKTGNYPKVKVVAKVDDFNSDYGLIQLEPLQNIDGKTPSVTSR